MQKTTSKGSYWSQLLAALRQLDADQRSGKVQRPRQVFLAKSLVAHDADAAIESMLRETRRLCLLYPKRT